MKNIYDLAVFIGRFQIFHKGHEFVIDQALNHADKVLVLVGSSNRPRDIFNPFTFEERKQMILSSFSEHKDRIIIRPLEDVLYNDTKWVEDVQRTIIDVASTINSNRLSKTPKPAITLIGHSKDNSSYYLKLFPQWDCIDVPNYENFSATPMRETYFSNIGHLWVVNADGHNVGDKAIEHQVSTPVREFLESFIKTPEYKYIKDEYEFVRDYKLQWRVTTNEGKSFPPYPITFTTVDCLVECGGHVLLIKRRASPGKNQLALPGGFLDYRETIEDGVFRELVEETKIKVPLAILKGNVVNKHVFDYPNRSSRGRTITHCYHVKLKNELTLPMVKGADDAISASWVEIAKLNSKELFEDHYDIIKFFLNS